MSKKNEIVFTHLQTAEDEVILKLIVSHIYNVPRILIWSCFSLLLCVGIILGVNDDNRMYGVPLAILAGVIFLGTLALLLYVLRAKPMMLRSIAENTSVTCRLTFFEKNFTVAKDGKKTEPLPYRQLIGQYWFEDWYIVHIRIPDMGRGFRDELLIVPLTQETFDEVYVLADALTAQKKRLVRIKGKKSKNG